MREKFLINQNWKFVKKADNAEDAARQPGETVCLPHTWNSADGQDGGNDYYRGTCWYVQDLYDSVGQESLEKQIAAGRRIFLEIAGAACTSEVFINGRKLAHHEDGFSTYRIDLTDALARDHKGILVISCDNADNDHVYPQKADFTFYGGLYRDVSIVIADRVHFALMDHGTSGLAVTPETDLQEKSAHIRVQAHLEGLCPSEEADRWQVHFELLDARGNRLAAETSDIDEDSISQTAFDIRHVHLWDGVTDPYLYTMRAKLCLRDDPSQDIDVVSTRFGCRVMEMDPQKGFFLNGRSYPLRGVAMHQDYKGLGNALTMKQFQEDMAFIREIGANTVRLAHYQYPQMFYDLCDENGIVVWTEIPFITMYMKHGRQNTLDQMRDLVLQNYNHPSIAVWGLSNEITAASVVNADLLENIRELNELCHRLDPTRKTTMANVFMLETDSPLLDIPDVNSYNLYFGWYVGDMQETDAFFDAFHQKYPNRVIGFSEYGADANPAYQAENPQQGDYTEGYQALYHEHMIRMIQARPYLWATHVWNLFDFAADGRDEGGKHGENQKGLVTFDRKVRKDAFYAYKAVWNRTEPFVHLCGRRYVNRESETTRIKVYSNLPSVRLIVDGEDFGEKTGNGVFEWKVRLHSSKNTAIVAEAAVREPFHPQKEGMIVRDEMNIRKAEEADPSYQYQKGSKNAANWFDSSDLNPDCFSVEDTLGELRKNAQAAEVVEAMMSAAARSRGDVAEAVRDNPGLQKMLARMTLVSLLKQGGASAEDVKQLNRVLQTIPRKERR